MALGWRVAAQAQAGQIETAADTARGVEDPEEMELALAGIERHKQDRRPWRRRF